MKNDSGELNKCVCCGKVYTDDVHMVCFNCRNREVTLTISKEGNSFVVDDRSRPGSPRVGRGRTMNEAIGDYFHANQNQLSIKFEIHGTAQPAEMRRRRRELSRR